MLRRLSVLFVSMYLLAATASGQANGKLQIHHIDVGQGDGAVLISPAGQVVVFDAGEDLKKRDCTRPVSYLEQLGVKHIDYLYVSHYHFDHIGCIPAVLGQFSLVNDAFDRGNSYPGATYTNYVNAVGAIARLPRSGTRGLWIRRPRILLSSRSSRSMGNQSTEPYRHRMRTT
jgi:beta-lactamase superfamily II metal-dependent hydrolase